MAVIYFHAAQEYVLRTICALSQEATTIALYVLTNAAKEIIDIENAAKNGNMISFGKKGEK